MTERKVKKNLQNQTNTGSIPVCRAALTPAIYVFTADPPAYRPI